MAALLLRNGVMRLGEETSYSETRGAGIQEHIYRLDEPSDHSVI